MASSLEQAGIHVRVYWTIQGYFLLDKFAQTLKHSFAILILGENATPSLACQNTLQWQTDVFGKTEEK